MGKYEMLSEPLQVVVLNSLTQTDCDSELERNLKAILHGSKSLALAQLRIQCDGDRVLITGDLATYFLKQAAQELVRPWILNRVLCNECKVSG